MKTIKNLSVKVTYYVQYHNITIPDEIHEELLNNSEFTSSDIKPSNAMEWLAENTSEDDALEWEYEVNDIE